MKKMFYISFLLIIGIVSGCKWLEDFGDTNINPNTTSEPVTGALLTSVLSNLGSVGYAGYYCQYFSETTYPAASLYSSNSLSPMNIYSGVLYDLQNIINTNSNETTRVFAEDYGANENQIAIARILKVYIFWGITDLWGDVPYSEALKEDPNVKYDTQESIYKDMIRELTEAVAQFIKSERGIKGDIAYNGDIAKWKKFANSLRLLMSLNLSKQYPDASGYSALQFKAALDDPAGSIENNSDNFMLDYPGGEVFLNPFYGFNRWNVNGESATLVSLLVDSLGGDMRQSAFGADRNGNPSSLGVPYGRDRDYIDPWSQQHPTYCYVLAPAFRGQAGPFFIINASSVLLARAEAADRGWTAENTSSLYQEGITASFTQWGLEAPDADYFTRTKVALGAAGKNLKQIATQQYLAYYPNGIQGWNTWRRTGWPVLSPAPDAINSPKVIPRRFMYGSSDYSLTATGVAEAVARLGSNGDKMDSRVWWDKD